MISVSNIVEFNRALTGFLNQSIGKAREHERVINIEANQRLIAKTPVKTGRARGNWQVTFDAPMTTPTEITDPGGEATHARAIAAISAMRPFGVTYHSNSVPYILVLENGGYPNPPKRGTYVKAERTRSGRKRRGTGQYVIMSAGGYSLQAPAGMMAITLQEMQSRFEVLS